MTGRRPVRQWDERLSRALQFVPGHVGGRVASAQPIRRRGGTLRQASVGAAAPLVTLEHYYSGTVTSSASTISTSMTGSAGDLVVCMVAAHGYTIADPSGSWTNVLSGTVTDLAYRVSYIVDTAGTATSDFGLSGAGTGAAMQTFRFAGFGSRVPTATAAVETPSASSVSFPPIPSGAASPWQVLAYAPTTPGAFSTTSTPAWIQTDSLSEIAVAGVMQLNVMQPRDPTWLEAFPGPVGTDSTLTTSAGGEWVTFGMGLA